MSACLKENKFFRCVVWKWSVVLELRAQQFFLFFFSQSGALDVLWVLVWVSDSEDLHSQKLSLVIITSLFPSFSVFFKLFFCRLDSRFCWKMSLVLTRGISCVASSGFQAAYKTKIIEGWKSSFMPLFYSSSISSIAKTHLVFKHRFHL